MDHVTAPLFVTSFETVTPRLCDAPSFNVDGGVEAHATDTFGLIVMTGDVWYFDESVCELTVTCAVHCALGEVGGM
jgi:hypothetical protein